MATSLAARCHGAFPPLDRDRGVALWRARAVRLEATEETRVEGFVHGSQEYEVEVDWGEARRGELTVYCACPRFADHGVCKHLWAAILEMDLRALAARVPGSGGLRVVGWGDPRRAPPPAPPAAPGATPDSWYRGARPGPPPASGSPWAPWRRQLSELAQALGRSAAPAAAPPRAAGGEVEVRYVCDVPASRTLSTLVVRFFERRRRRDGEWSKPKPLSLDGAGVRRLPDERDRALLELLRAFPYSTWGTAGQAQEWVRVGAAAVPRPFQADVLARLSATGRLSWWDALTPPDFERRWRWDDGAPWQLRIALARSGGGGVTLRGELVRGDAVRPLADAVLTVPGLVGFAGEIAPLEAGEAYPAIALLRARPLEVPPEGADQALAEIYSLPALPPLTGDPALRLREERHPPRPFLRVSRPQAGRYGDRWGGAGELDVAIGFAYDDLEVAAGDPRPALPDPRRKRLLVRDRDAEAAASAAAGELPLRPLPGAEPGWLALPERKLVEVVDRLLALGWRVELEGRPLRRAGAVRFSVASGIDWLDLAMAAEFGGAAASSEALLAALARRQRFVALGDGSHGVVPQEWLDRYGGLARLAAGASEAGLRFAPSQALLLDALLAEAPEVDVDAAFSRLRERLASGARPRPVAEPPGFAGTLRAYQREGLGWLRFLAEVGFGGCLADDMGLGKTVQVLARLAELAEGGEAIAGGNGAGGTRGGAAAPGGAAAAPRLPSLVVAPRSVVHNWLDEARRFAPALRVLDYGGSGRAALRRRIPEHDLVVTTYGVVRLDAAHLRAQPFAYLVLDEAQAVKNAGTQAHKACRLLQARHRLALSGTPVENHLGELWALLELLNPGLLGRLPAARSGGASRAGEAGRVGDGRQGSGAAGDGQGAGPGGGAIDLSDAELAAVGRAVRPFLLRRTKEQVLTELPAKTEQTLVVALEGPQRRLYDELRRHYQAALGEQIRTAGLARSKILVLEALLRLRQAACHPGLVDPDRAGDGSAKLDTLLAQLEELREEGHKALVFSQFTRLLALLKPRLDRAGIRYEYLDGRTRDRKAKVERFQGDPDCSVFLVSLKAGGLGLNLTAAGYVFLLDPWWNPAVEAQAVDRAHRIGQRRPVFAYRLIAEDTVEEKILELQQKKRRVADAILAADASVLQALTAEDLELLLS